jgi:hypothetical protein
MQSNLETVKQLQKQYMDLRGAMGSKDTQLDDLEKMRKQLTHKLNTMQDVANTYDREYFDRLEGGEVAPSFWRAKGFNTTADWALAGVYITYFFMVFVTFIYVARYSSKKIFASTMVLVFGLLIGMMITAFLLRFA